jgi:lysozyme
MSDFPGVMMGPVLWLVLSLPYPPAFSQESKPQAAKLPMLGLDVSHHDGAVDWQRVYAAGYRFAYVKASEGIDWVDPLYQENMAGLRQAGIPCGAYHFFMVQDSGKEQAHHFLSTIVLQKGDLLPVVDVESWHADPQADVKAELRLFLDEISASTGQKAIIYTNARFWNQHFDASFADHPLWIAEYEVEEPQLPSGWQAWFLWQFSEKGAVAGIAGSVDLSRFAGSEKDFTQLLISTLPATPSAE